MGYKDIRMGYNRKGGEQGTSWEHIMEDTGWVIQGGCQCHDNTPEEKDIRRQTHRKTIQQERYSITTNKQSGNNTKRPPPKSPGSNMKQLAV